MDLFGSAPNLKCSNESVPYNAAVRPQAPSNNRAGSRLGFDCVVPSILLLDKLHHSPQSSSVSLASKCYNAHVIWWRFLTVIIFAKFCCCGVNNVICLIYIQNCTYVGFLPATFLIMLSRGIITARSKIKPKYQLSLNNIWTVDVGVILLTSFVLFCLTFNQAYAASTINFPLGIIVKYFSIWIEFELRIVALHSAC